MVNIYTLTIYDSEDNNKIESYVFYDKTEGQDFLKRKYNRIYYGWKKDEYPEAGIVYIDENKSINPSIDIKHSMIVFLNGARIDFFFGKAKEINNKGK